MLRKPRIIVTGFVGLFPFGGVAWDYLQYVAGFTALGWDAVYLEDTGSWPVYQRGDSGSALNVAHLASAMEYLGLGERWAYRDALSGECFGLSEAELSEYCRTADIFLNLSCSATLREEYAAIPVRALVDTDPMFTQIQYLRGKSLTDGPTGIRELIANHTHRFTFGGSIGSAPCRIPTLGLQWHPTRPPVVLKLWSVSDPPAGAANCYSTVMNWSVVPDFEFEGERWGQKDVEFMRFLQLPRRVPQIPLGLAIGQTPECPFPIEEVRDAGWIVYDSALCAPDARGYQRFIGASRGEFSVAKQTYVKANTGWFSCRSTCYLAAGRPVVTQDTTWSRLLPSGRGLLAFHDEETAVDALRQVASDPKAHSRAAREIAQEYFDSDRVLGEMLAHMGA
jgi:hypothetical protein